MLAGATCSWSGALRYQPFPQTFPNQPTNLPTLHHFPLIFLSIFSSFPLDIILLLLNLSAWTLFYRLRLTCMLEPNFACINLSTFLLFFSKHIQTYHLACKLIMGWRAMIMSRMQEKCAAMAPLGAAVKFWVLTFHAIQPFHTAHKPTSPFYHSRHQQQMQTDTGCHWNCQINKRISSQDSDCQKTCQLKLWVH